MPLYVSERFVVKTDVAEPQCDQLLSNAARENLTRSATPLECVVYLSLGIEHVLLVYRGRFIMLDEQLSLENFNGKARLFPLPNLVLFPGVEQGLHIFEYRYRDMAADALASDKLVAMVLLKPNWELDYDAKPAIEQVCCLGRIIESEELPDGRYNLRLLGLARFAIETELRCDDKLYRTASGRLINDGHGKNINDENILRSRLQHLLQQRYATHPAAMARLIAVFDAENTNSMVCDQLSYCLPLSLDVKQQLLVEAIVVKRFGLLLLTLE